MTFLKTTICAISRSINTAKDTRKVTLAATAVHPHCILILLHSPFRFSWVSPLGHARRLSLLPNGLWSSGWTLPLETRVPCAPQTSACWQAWRGAGGLNVSICWTPLPVTFCSPGICGTGRSSWIKLCFGTSSSGSPACAVERLLKFLHKEKSILIVFEPSNNFS